MSIKNFIELMGDSRKNPQNPRDPFVNPDIDPTPMPKPHDNPETEPSADTDAPQNDREKNDDQNLTNKADLKPSKKNPRNPSKDDPSF